jgi:hypothetical protein
MLADPLTKDLSGPKMTKFTDPILNKKYSGLKGNDKIYEVS